MRRGDETHGDFIRRSAPGHCRPCDAPLRAGPAKVDPGVGRSVTRSSSPSRADTAVPDERYSSRNLMSRLWRGYLAKHRYWMALAVVLMMIEGGALAVLARLLEPMFDRVFVGGDLDAIWWIGGAILGLFTIRGISDLIKQAVLTRIAQKSSTEMQSDLVEHLLTLDSAFFHENPPGSLMERVQGDTAAVQQVWAIILQGAGRDFFSLFWLFAVAISIDPVWTLAAMVAAPAVILPTMALQRYIRRKAHQSREQASLRSTRLSEVFHGIDSIKLNQLEDYQLSRFRSIVDRIVKAQIKIAASRATVPALVDIVTGVGFFAVLLIGGQAIVSGEKTVGEFMSFFTAMSLTFQPLRRLGGVAGTWQVAATSLERLYRLFDEEPGIVAPARPAAPPAKGETEIRFENVSLSYDEMPALRGASFTARAGETTALVGPSGAGKTTIFNVLTRLVDPQEGRVTVGGRNLLDMTLADLRALYSVVSQNTLLFDETLRENILLGQSGVEEEYLHRVLNAAHVDDFLPRLGKGLESPAGPRGANLSGGQQQRIAIARALLRDAPVLLLDEATSALDSKSETAVQGALDKLSKNRTTLVIAHRLSTIRDADSIVVMDRGRVAEQGRHDELLSSGGLYADLHALQAKSEPA